MCGQYRLIATKQALYERYHVDVGVELELANDEHDVMFPSGVHPVLLPNMEFHLVKWGLKPSFAKRPLINARVETVLKKPTFREPFRRKRCIIPATHFYEWQQNEHSSDKTKWIISVKNMSIFSMAGVCERYSDGEGGSYLTYAILTCEANEQMAGVHDRMPVILEPSSEASYLDLTADPKDILKMITRSADLKLIVRQ